VANTFNGIGTTFYGQGKFESDQSFITTKWFVLGFFPLFPLGSARVIYLGSSGVPFLSRSAEFEVVEALPIQWIQVLMTWIYAVFIITWVIGLLASNKPPFLKVVLIALGIFLPFIIRWMQKRFAQ
jgi:hypothetical protein